MSDDVIKINTRTKKGERDAELIAEGCKLNRQIKIKEKRLAEIKAQLKHLAEGKYMTPNGKTVNVILQDQMSAIDPEAAQKALRDLRKGKEFMGCVKVMMDEIKRRLDPDVLKTLQSKCGTIRKYSFKG